MQKKRWNKREGRADFSRSSDKELKKFEELLNVLTKRYKISAIELLQSIKKDIIPVCIFTKKTSPLETVCKYLRENLGYSNKNIASLLNRSEKTVWQAYAHSKKKFAKKFIIEFSENDFNASVLSNRKFSILESAVVYLKDKRNLKYHTIALLLKRDERTVWTCYSRAKKK